MIFFLFVSFIVLVRIAELFYAARNEKILRLRGAIEYGKGHYPLMVLLHTSFFVALIIEYLLRSDASCSIIFIVLFCLLLLVKVWIISTLGPYWNTKILRVPNGPLVNKGPYKYFRHPNYILVILEIAIIPLAFHLNVTACVFSLLNLAMLRTRIRVENVALNGGNADCS